MTHSRIYLLIVAALLAISSLLSSCIEDGFTTSPNDVLAFNMDTVAFDTVITLQGTATKQMIVYNRSPKQINISSIKVAGLASKGHFHLNVDGIRGDEFQNVEIRGNDSIYIFIEARLDEMEQDEPTLIEDRLEFVTNGMSQKVALTAWGQDVVRIFGDTISRSRHFNANKPYLIYDTLFVAEDATLTIDAGATLLFHDKAAMRCAGRMLANGTAEEPITFRGDRLDRVVGEISFDIMSGQWGGVIFTPPTMGNVLKHVIMKGSSIGMHCMAYGDTTRCALKLINCVLTNSASTCLAAANYYLFKAPSFPIVNVYDVEYEDGTIGKIKAYFDNCIMYGLSREINEGDLEGFDVYLRYCMLKSDGKDDNHFINCVWNADAEQGPFLTVRDDYLFDYRLRNESDAIGKGNPALCPPEARYDRYGNDRLASGAVDLGAYVWIPQAEE